MSGAISFAVVTRCDPHPYCSDSSPLAPEHARQLGARIVPSMSGSNSLAEMRQTAVNAALRGQNSAAPCGARLSAVHGAQSLDRLDSPDQMIPLRLLSVYLYDQHRLDSIGIACLHELLDVVIAGRSIISIRPDDAAAG